MAVSLDQFRTIANGDHNLGQIRLGANNKLEKVNNHYWRTGSNDVNLSIKDNRAVRNELMAALENTGLDAEKLAKYRDILLGGGRDSLSLDRDFVRQLLADVDGTKPLEARQIMVVERTIKEGGAAAAQYRKDQKSLDMTDTNRKDDIFMMDCNEIRAKFKAALAKGLDRTEQDVRDILSVFVSPGKWGGKYEGADDVAHEYVRSFRGKLKDDPEALREMIWTKIERASEVLGRPYNKWLIELAPTRDQLNYLNDDPHRATELLDPIVYDFYDTQIYEIKKELSQCVVSKRKPDMTSGDIVDLCREHFEDVLSKKIDKLEKHDVWDVTVKGTPHAEFSITKDPGFGCYRLHYVSEVKNITKLRHNVSHKTATFKAPGLDASVRTELDLVFSINDAGDLEFHDTSVARCTLDFSRAQKA